MFLNKHCTYLGRTYFRVKDVIMLYLPHIILFKDENVSRFSGLHQCTFKVSLLQGSIKKNKGNRNQSYDGNLHILTFFSLTEHVKLINQMTDSCTFQIPKFGVFAFFVILSNLSGGETFPNERVNAFQTHLLNIFTLQNHLSGLRLTISSRN